MLASLTVHDIVLIDRLGIDFDAGLTVLTGETGAGKSILLDALSLALGARGDSRAGARRARSAARSRRSSSSPPDHPVVALLAENGIEAEGRVILRRVAGRRRQDARLRQRPARAAWRCCARSARLLVEIHGQHDDRALVRGERASAAARRLRAARGGRDGGRGALPRSARAGGRRLRGCARRSMPRRARRTTCAPRSRSWRRSPPEAGRGGRRWPSGGSS